MAAVFRAIYMKAWCGTHEVMPRYMRVWKALDCGPMLSASSVGSFGLSGIYGWVSWWLGMLHIGVWIMLPIVALYLHVGHTSVAIW